MLGRAVSTVATGVTITIELPARVMLRNVLGRAYRQTGNRIEIDFHDLGGGASKYSLLELTIPRGDEGQVLDALVARARYRRVADNREGETSARTQVRYTSQPAGGGGCLGESGGSNSFWTVSFRKYLPRNNLQHGTSLLAPCAAEVEQVK